MNWYGWRTILGGVGLLVLIGSMVVLAQDDPLAQQVIIVPAVETGQSNTTSGSSVANPEIVNEQTDDLQLSEVGTNALLLSETWQHKDAPVFLGTNGRVIYQYGATLFPIVAAPGYITDVVFQVGETFEPEGIRSGDNLNWHTEPFPQTLDNGDVIAHLIIKPVLTNIRTTMVIATNRRVYYLALESTKDRFMTSVGFHYPNDNAKDWETFNSAIARGAERKKVESEQASAGSSIRVPDSSGKGHTDEPIGTVDFNFKISGDTPVWRPVRVYALNGKTYIELPKRTNFTRLPAFFELGKTSKKFLVNSRYIHNTIIVDKLIKRGVLVSGVGISTVKVEIKYTGDK